MDRKSYLAALFLGIFGSVSIVAFVVKSGFSVGNAPWCSVDAAGNTSCIYWDERSCYDAVRDSYGTLTGCTGRP